MSADFIRYGRFYPVEIEGRGFTAICQVSADNVESYDGRRHWCDCRISGIYKTLKELRTALEYDADQGFTKTLTGAPATKLARFRIFVKAEQAADFLNAERIEFIAHAKAVRAAGEVFGRKGVRRCKEYSVFVSRFEYEWEWVDCYPTLEKAKAAAREFLELAPLHGVRIGERVSVSTGHGMQGFIGTRTYESKDGVNWTEEIAV